MSDDHEEGQVLGLRRPGHCLWALKVPDKLSSSREIDILKRAILCECGEFVRGHTFKDFIPTSISPSTPTFGHSECGLIFDLVDGELPRSFSTRIQLKSIAMRFAEMNKMEDGSACLFLLEVDRLKSRGNVCDMDILIAAHRIVQERTSAAGENRPGVECQETC